MALARQFFAPVLATCVLLISKNPLRAQEINWRHSYEEARREAQETGRLSGRDRWVERIAFRHCMEKQDL